MKSLNFNLTLCLLFAAMLLLWTQANAATNMDEAQVAGTYTQAGKTQNLGILAGVPINTINGFIYGDWQRAVSDDVVLEENATLYIEGGVKLGGFGLSGYAKGLKDEGRVFGWQRDYGYFVRIPTLQTKGFTFTGGAGNFARQEIPEIDVEAETSFNWRGFVEVEHESGLHLLLETTSTINLNDPEFRAVPFTSIEVGENFTLDLSLEILRADGKTHTQTIIAGKKTF